VRARACLKRPSTPDNRPPTRPRRSDPLLAGRLLGRGPDAAPRKSIGYQARAALGPASLTPPLPDASPSIHNNYSKPPKPCKNNPQNLPKTRPKTHPKTHKKQQFFDLATNAHGRRSFFTTNDEAQWAVVRKGCAQAFSPSNIRRRVAPRPSPLAGALSRSLSASAGALRAAPPQALLPRPPQNPEPQTS